MSVEKYADCGYVYVVESSDRLSVKIGKSISPEKRVATIKSQAGLSGRHWISTFQNEHGKIERACHRKLTEFRTVGEWFAVGFDDAIDAVKSLLGEEVDADLELAAKRKSKKDEGEKIFNAMHVRFFGGLPK